MITLAEEFIERYYLFIRDCKPQRLAMALSLEEFKHKIVIQEDVPNPQTLLRETNVMFIDSSACGYNQLEWRLIDIKNDNDEHRSN